MHALLHALSYGNIDVESSRRLADLKKLDALRIFLKKLDTGIYNGDYEVPVRLYFPTEEDMKEYASPYHGMTLATFNQIQRPNQAYPIYVDDEGCIIGCGRTLQERIEDGSYQGELGDFVYKTDDVPSGATAIWPISAKGEQCVWRLIPNRLLGDYAKGYIKVIPTPSDKAPQPYGIQYLSEGIILIFDKNIAYPIAFSNADNLLFSKVVDGLAQTINHLFQRSKDLVTKPSCPKFFPNLFNGIHLRRIGRDK